MLSKTYGKANNPRVEGYDPTQQTNYITYLDANNLYGWAMSLHLPKKNFHWKRVMPTEEQIMKMKWNSKEGLILEGPRVPRLLARRHQCLPAGAGKESDKTRDVGIPAAAYDRS